MEVVTSVNVPFDLVSVSLGSKTLEAMAFSNFASLLVGGFLVLFVVSVVWVDQVLPFADFVFGMYGLDFDVVQRRFLQLLSQIRERMLDVVGSALVLSIIGVANLFVGRVDMRRLSDKSHTGVRYN